MCVVFSFPIITSLSSLIFEALKHGENEIVFKEGKKQSKKEQDGKKRIFLAGSFHADSITHQSKKQRKKKKIYFFLFFFSNF